MRIRRFAWHRAGGAAVVLSVACSRSDANGSGSSSGATVTGAPTATGSTTGSAGNQSGGNMGGGGSAGGKEDGSGSGGEGGAGGSGVDAGPPGASSASVLQHHKNASRDGLYVDPIFTKEAAAHVRLDTTFQAIIEGPTYAQALYWDAGANGQDLLFVATAQNRVYALDAQTGSPVWQRMLGAPAPKASLPCGNIDPLGITGTPVIDPVSRRMFLDAMTTPDGGTTMKHLIFALSIDDGSVVPGWPVDASATVKTPDVSFDSRIQNQRGALLLSNGMLYLPYGGHGGDCESYHGWVVAVPTDDPSKVTAFATAALHGGIWAPGGLSSDGTSIFAATGNTLPGATWGHGEAVLRFKSGAVFSGQAADYFAPSNWLALDVGDFDLGGSGSLLVDVPGATPSELAVALGKNGVAYLLDRSNLGGIGKGNGTTGEGLASAQVASGVIVNAPAAYTTAKATYAVLQGTGTACPGGSDIVALEITAAAPPRISVAWCGREGGFGSPIVTTTDGHSDAVVWTIGAGVTNLLTGFDADTGAVVFVGGGSPDIASAIRPMSTLMAAKGRLFIAGDSAVYAFSAR